MDRGIVVQHDDDPKHRVMTVRKRLHKKRFKSSDLKQIESLWRELKLSVALFLYILDSASQLRCIYDQHY